MCNKNIQKVLFFTFILSNFALAEETIKLKESYINSDYMEIQKLKSTKNVILIEKKDFENRGYKNLTDVLDDIPSINVGKSGLGIIDIRGQGRDMASKNIKFLIDGVSVTALTSHPFKFDYNLVPIENIDRVEVIPSGGSVFYGSGAAGGIINITTNSKRPAKSSINISAKKDEKRYSVSLTNNLTKDLRLHLAYSKINKNLYFKDTFRNTQYFSSGLKYQINEKNDISFRYSNLKEDSKYLENIDYKKIQLFGKDALPKSKKKKFIVNGKVAQKEVIPYKIGDRNFHNYGIEYNSKLTDNLSLKYNYGFTKGKYIGNDDTERNVTFKSYSHNISLNYDYGKNNFEGSNLLLGYDYSKSKSLLKYDEIKGLVNKPAKINNLFFDYKKSVEAFYIFNTLKYNNFTFTQGFRDDTTTWDTKKTDKTNINSKTNKYFSGIDKRKNNAFSLGLSYLYSDTGKIYVNYEKGFRSPDGVEITEYFKNTYALSYVKDEKYNMYEIGLRDHLLGSSLNLVAFYSKTDNQIASPIIKTSDGLYYKKLNLYDSTRYGFEGELEQKIGKFFFKEQYTYTRGRTKYTSEYKKYNINNKHNFSENYIDKVPKHKVTLKAGYNFTDRFSSELSYQYSGKYGNYIVQSDKNPNIKIKSNTIVDLTLKYKHENGLTLYGGITNLFNENYYSYASLEGFTTGTQTIIPEDRRTFYIGAKYTF